MTGDLTVGQVLTMLPYANAVSIFTVAGSALIAAVKNGLSAYPSGGRFLQVGSAKLVLWTCHMLLHPSSHAHMP